MKNLRTIIIVLITMMFFWFIKFYLKFPSADVEIIEMILTIASILFGVLAGFFISELWSRYTEIRTLQGERSSSGLNMTKYAKYFFKNIKFKNKFVKLVEIVAVADEIIEWDEGHIELPYYRDVEDSFKYIKIKNQKDQVYFENLATNYNDFVRTTTKLDTLGKERLFISEWLMVGALSLIIAFSVLFFETSHIFYKIIILVFPSIVTLTLSIMYDLDRLLWSKEEVSLEPNERLFDTIDVKRFYLKKKKKFISSHIKDYRTEDDLKGDLKKVYNNIIKKQKIK